MTYFATEMAEDVRLTDKILENDYMCQAFIQKKLHAFEPMLMETKWFDYRFLTPLEATKRYIDTYGEIYRRIYAREFDRGTSEHLQVLSWERLVSKLETDATKWKRVLSGCWRGRQFADGIGIPYDQYIELAFTSRMRRWQQAHMPQPSHLYHPVTLDIVSQKWEERISTQLWTSDHPAYLVQNYAELPVQNAYHEWMFKQAELRGNRPEALARIVLMDMLPLAKVYARYPDPVDHEKIDYYLEHP